MQRILLVTFCALILIPISSGFSQTYDTPSTLAVVLTSEQPFVYTDSDGYTFVVGEVANNDSQTSVNDIVIQVSFYNESNSLVDTVAGGPVMDVIPPNGKSPYIIKSNDPDTSIVAASVSVQKFNPSTPKLNGLTVETTSISLSDNLRFSGILQNNGGAPISDTKVVATFYDGFQPPRIIGVSSIDIGEVEIDGESVFNFDGKIDARAIGFKLFADSDVFYSDSIDVKIPQSEITTRLVTISDVSVIDNNNIKTSQIIKGFPAKIKSGASIQFSADQESFELPYTYYVQVKQSIKESNDTVTFVEFLGTSDGSFLGAGKEFPSVEWTPENTGIYFIETYVWDSTGVPIANVGPVTLVLVS